MAVYMEMIFSYVEALVSWLARSTQRQTTVLVAGIVPFSVTIKSSCIAKY